jgi:hypothetical protein
LRCWIAIEEQYGVNKKTIQPKMMLSDKQTTEMEELEQIFPGIYLTLCEDQWTTDKLRTHGFTHIIRIDKHITNNHIKTSLQTNLLDRDQHHLDGFETLDLNFGETSYLTTVLPNCYKGEVVP